MFSQARSCDSFKPVTKLQAISRAVEILYYLSVVLIFKRCALSRATEESPSGLTSAAWCMMTADVILSSGWFSKIEDVPLLSISAFQI